MAVSVADLQTDLNTYLGDATTQRLSSLQRLSALTEATVWLQESLRNDHQNFTYALNYYDTVHTYKVTSTIAYLLEAADMRRGEDDQTERFSFTSAASLAVIIGSGSGEESYAIDRHDNQAYLLVNHNSKNQAQTISNLDSTTSPSGTWAADSVNSTATNLRQDTVTYKTGSASLAFDTNSALSANLRATITNSTIGAFDLTQYNNSGSFLLWVYLPYIANASSVTLYWGSSSSNYWSATVTTDMNANAFVVGWQRLRFDWTASTQTGSPTITAVNYFRIDINFSSNSTKLAYRIDQLLVCNPEVLTFYYTAWNIGTDNAFAPITKYSATTDIPYFSGLYDQYRFAVSHYAASILFATPLRLADAAKAEESKAFAAMERAKGIIPSSAQPQTNTFKPMGISFRRRGNRRGRR